MRIWSGQRVRSETVWLIRLTLTVDAGDGDFLMAKTLWDFKVSKDKLTSKQTLQLLMYWIMGQHSGQSVKSKKK